MNEFEVRQSTIKKKRVHTFVFLHQMKKGGFGTVFKVRNSKNKKIYAMKQIPIPKTPHKAERFWIKINREIRIMREINSPNVVKLKGKGSTKNNIYLLQEFCNQGDLHEYCRNNPITLPLIKKLGKDILLGVKALHDKDIIHRDIKFGNIVLHQENNELIAKLCDFGVSRFLGKNSAVSTYCGTEYFLAPEVRRKKENKKSDNYTLKADIWSVGILFILFSFYLRKYIPDDFQVEIKDHLMKGKIPIWSELYDNQIFQNFINDCIQQDPAKRKTISELVNHKFFQIS